MAQDQSLSIYEKIGFPNSYREGKESAIFADIVRKLPALDSSGKIAVLDIGLVAANCRECCIRKCAERGHALLLVDSPEMFELVNSSSYSATFPGRFPGDCKRLIRKYAGRIDAILTYSVLHYVFRGGEFSSFWTHAWASLAGRDFAYWRHSEHLRNGNGTSPQKQVSGSIGVS